MTKVPKALIQKVSEWESCQKDLFVYYFSLPQNTDLEIVHRKVTEAKKNKVGKRAYPRINSASRYLYVGSSKEITKRFKEHLGYSYKGTYAMQLAYWCDDLDLDIVFSCMRFSKKTRVDVIQAFEDGLWDHLNPMLGRRGAR